MLRAFVFGLLVVAVAGGALAQSQRQTPRAPPSGQNAQPAAPDQRGTDQVPFAVKILPTQPAKEETEKAEAEKTEKSAIDRKLAFETQRIADYTWNLAAVTAFLFLVAVVQAGMFVWQLLLLRRGAHDATLAANAAKLAAEATVEQSRLMGLQLDLVEKQHGVARHQFFSANRPRLIVHFVRRVLEHPDDHHSDQPVAVEFTVANVGTNDAWVTESRIAVERFRPGRWPHPDELDALGARELILSSSREPLAFPVGSRGRFIARSAPSGGLEEALGVTARDPTPQEISQAWEDAGNETGDRLYLIGWIEYVDGLDNPLVTYFCRERNRDTGRFAPPENCEWEDRHD